MIPSFKPGIMSSNQIRKAAVPSTPPCTDCTPNAINWSSGIGYSPMTNGETRRLTGVDGYVTLKLSYTKGTVYVGLNSSGSEGPFTTPFAPSLYGTARASGVTFNVNPNTYITLTSDGPMYDTDTLSVINVSDGNTTLDTVAMGWSD